MSEQYLQGVIACEDGEVHSESWSEEKTRGYADEYQRQSMEGSK